MLRFDWNLIYVELHGLSIQYGRISLLPPPPPPPPYKDTWSCISFDISLLDILNHGGCWNSLLWKKRMRLIKLAWRGKIILDPISRPPMTWWLSVREHQQAWYWHIFSQICPGGWIYNTCSMFCWLVITNMMTSSNENIFRINGPLCGEYIGHRRIPLTKASDMELWCFFDLHLNERLDKQSIRR